MKNILILGMIFFTSLVHAQVKSISNVKLSDLANAKREVYMVVNQTITPQNYSSVQIEKNKGGIFSSDKYTMRITFSFDRSNVYGTKEGVKFLPIPKGTILKLTDAKPDLNYSATSAYYISAQGKETRLSANEITFASAYVQILGSKKDSVSKLTVGDLEKTFDNAITLYVK